MSEEDSVSIVPEEEVYRRIEEKVLHFLKLPLSLLRDFPI